MTELQLRKRLLDVERALHAESSLFEEYLLIQRRLEAVKPGGRPLYADIGSIIEAIEQAFEIRGVAMTKQQVFEELMLGGFPFKPNLGRRLVGNTLNYHAKRGRVARHGDLFGNTAWAKSKFVE